MGRTLYCDCCGQDIRHGGHFYAVKRIANRTSSRWYKTECVNDSEEWIVCGDCFHEIGEKVKKMHREINIEVE